MIAHDLERLHLAAALTAAVFRGIRQFGDGSVHADFKDFQRILEPCRFAIVAEIGTVAPDLCCHGLAGFGMDTNFAWQRKKFDGPFEPEIFGRNILGDRRTFGFLALAFFNIGTETTHFPGDLFIAVGINAQFLRTFILVGIGSTALCKAPGELAFRIVGAGHKGTKTATAQGQLAFVAAGTEARITAIFLFGEQIVGEEYIQLCRHFRRHFFHHFDGLGFEIMPKGFEYGLPLCATATDFVQFIFQSGRIIIGDIAIEKPLEKSGQ